MPLKAASVGQQVGWGRGLRKSSGQAKSVNLMKTQPCHLSADSVEGSFSKRIFMSSSTSLQEKADTPVLLLKSDDLILPCMSLSHLKLLPHNWVKMSPSNSMSLLFNRNVWDSRSSPFHTTTISSNFHNRSYEDFFSCHWNAGGGGPGVGLGSLAPWRDLPIFHVHT